MEVNGIEAVGAPDRPAVCQAVEEVMEGSEEAFRGRYEKYGIWLPGRTSETAAVRGRKETP
jgi:hypothetical protein